MLLFMTFLFINAEVWQVAGTLTGPVYVATLGIFFALGDVFILSRVPALMGALNHFDSWDEVDVPRRRHAGGRRLRAPRRPTATPADADRPTMRQRVNIGLSPSSPRPSRSRSSALALTGFFVLFGFLAIPEPTTAAVDGARPCARARHWYGRRPHAGDHRAADPGLRLPRCVHGDVLHRPCSRPTRPTARSSLTTWPRVAPSSGVRCVVPTALAASDGRPADGARRSDAMVTTTTDDIDIRISTTPPRCAASSCCSTRSGAR